MRTVPGAADTGARARGPLGRTMNWGGGGGGERLGGRQPEGACQGAGWGWGVWARTERRSAGWRTPPPPRPPGLDPVPLSLPAGGGGEDSDNSPLRTPQCPQNLTPWGPLQVVPSRTLKPQDSLLSQVLAVQPGNILGRESPSPGLAQDLLLRPPPHPTSISRTFFPPQFLSCVKVKDWTRVFQSLFQG